MSPHILRAPSCPCRTQSELASRPMAGHNIICCMDPMHPALLPLQLPALHCSSAGCSRACCAQPAGDKEEREGGSILLTLPPASFELAQPLCPEAGSSPHPTLNCYMSPRWRSSQAKPEWRCDAYTATLDKARHT